MLFEKYAMFHENEVEIPDLPKIRAAIKLAALQGEDLVTEVIQEAFKDFSKEAKERIFSHLQGIAMVEKSAWLKPIIGSLGIGFGLAPAIGKIYKNTRTKGQLERALREVLRRTPALTRDPEQTARNFELLMHFAPAIASEPTAASAILIQLQSLGESAITPDLLKRLVDVQKLRTPSADVYESAAKGLTSAGKLF